MSLPFKDISQWQGNYNMSANPDQLIAIKMGGGDNGIYMDAKAAVNYDNAVKAGKAVAGYWFAGGHDPIAEADYFLRCMAPLAENDVYILDWEINNPDPVGWCSKFINHIHDKIGTWCLIYINIYTLNAHDWSSVLANSGLWLAAPSYGFDETIPSVHHTYVAQQGPIVNGVDTDMAFMTLDEFKKYGWHKAQQQAAPPTPPTPPVEAPKPPVVDPTPTPPAIESKPPDTTTGVLHGEPVQRPVEVAAPQLNFWQELLALLKKFLQRPSVQ